MVILRLTDHMVKLEPTYQMVDHTTLYHLVGHS